MELNHGTKFISSAERILVTHGNALDPADIVQKVTSPKNTDVSNGEVDNKAEKNHTYITQVTFIVNKV